jgi:predicted esterase
MQKQFFPVTKTARYFTHGNLNANTKFIWIIIHGYAQTADAFLSTFESLESEHFLIAPEGLNKFYSRGFSGSPVASWMTSLEREHEISDYTNYLNNLVNTLNLVSFTHAKTIVLGFSQGVSTQTRFIESSDFKFDYSIMIAGEIGKEFQENLPQKLSTIKSLYLVGDKENILKPEKIESHQMLFKNANCEFKIFDGKHEVNQHAIDNILDFISE